jgi:small-conductance mechanosensitive channel
VVVFTDSLVNSMNLLWSKIVLLVPSLLAFLLIIAVGYIVARLVATLLRKVLSAVRVDAFSRRIGIRSALDRANVTADVSQMLASLVFWVLMLMFLVSGVESLGLDGVSVALGDLLHYLPRLFGAVLILMGGLYAAQLARELIVSGAEGIGVDQAKSLGTAVYGVLLVVVVTLAIGQLNLATDMLDSVIIIVLVTAGTAAAISFGFGSRTLAGNVLAGSYVRELVREGDRITVRDVTGVVTQITSAKTEIKTDDGALVTIPNRNLMESVVTRYH